MQNQGPIRIRWQSNYNIQWRVFQADFISKLSWISRSYKVSICLYNCTGLNYRALRESKNNIRLIKSSNRIWASTILKLLNLFGFQNGLRGQRLCFWSGQLKTTGRILGMTEWTVSLPSGNISHEGAASMLSWVLRGTQPHFFGVISHVQNKPKETAASSCWLFENADKRFSLWSRFPFGR